MNEDKAYYEGEVFEDITISQQKEAAGRAFAQPEMRAAETPPVVPDAKDYVEAPYLLKMDKNEAVSLGSGSLCLQYTDLVLPGKNGFDLVIARQYDSASSNEEDMSLYDRGTTSIYYYEIMAYADDCEVNYERSTYYLYDACKKAADAHKRKWLNGGHGYTPSKGEKITVKVEISKGVSGQYRGDKTRDNDYAVNTFGLGYGWSFKFPLIEKVDYNMDESASTGKNYMHHLHLDDSRVLYINNKQQLQVHNGSKFISYPMNDISLTYSKASKSFTVFYKEGRIDSFDEKGHIKTMTDRFGNTISFTYQNGRIHTITDSYDRLLTLVESTENGNKKLVWQLKYSDNSEHEEFSYIVNSSNQLIEVRNAEGEPTTYAYERKATIESLYPEESDIGWVDIIYNLLTRVIHPTGTQTAYSYNFYTHKYRGYFDGYKEVYLLASRYDYLNAGEYNRVNYEYALGSRCANRTTVTQGNTYLRDRKEVHSFNGDGRCTKKEILRSSGHPVATYTYSYGQNSGDADYRLLQTQTELLYNADGVTCAEKTVSYTYTADKLANIARIEEKYKDQPHLDRTTVMEYGANSLLTKKSYPKNEAVTITEEYELLDGKVVSKARIKENESAVEQTEYQYFHDGSYKLQYEHSYYDIAAGKRYTTEYAYNSAYRTPQPAAKKLGGVTQTFQYDEFGRVLESTDGKNTTQFSYDRIGRPTGETFADGGTTVKQYRVNAGEHSITVTDQLGEQQKFEYDPLGNISKVYLLHKNGTATLFKQYAYNAVGQLEGETVYNENGTRRNITSYSYDHLDRVLTKSTRDGGNTLLYSETFVYDDYIGGARNRVTQTVSGDANAASQKTVTETDLRGRITSQTSYPDAATPCTTSFTYDSMDNKLTSTDPRGNETRWSYDHAGRVTSESILHNGGWITAATGYYNNGQKKSFTDFKSSTASYIYNERGLLSEQRIPFEDVNGAVAYAVTRFYYDAPGNVIKQETSCSKPGEGTAYRTTESAYDSCNRLFKSIFTEADGAQNSTEYFYDRLGRCTEMYTGVINGDRSGAHLHKNSYNRFGVEKQIAPDQSTESFEYDNTGRLMHKTDRNGIRTSFDYDGLDRVISETKAGIVKSAKYTLTGLKYYDAVIENGITQAITSRYDGRGALVYQSDPDAIAKGYTYDENGNRRTFTLHRNNQLEINLFYEYDNLSRLWKVRKDGSGGAEIAIYTYDNNSNRRTLTYPNGVTASYDYNRANLVTSLVNRRNGTVVSSDAYTYYLDGNQATKKNKDNMTVSYEYDGAGRLKKESDPAWNTISYTFDRFGNRDTMTVSGAETYKTSYHYDPSNRLVLEQKAEADAVEQSRYSYDQNGNQLEKIWERTAKSKPDAKPGSVHFCMDGPKNQKAVYERRQYNTLNQLTHLYRDGEITIYSYRPDGLRHAKQTGRQSRPTATHRLTVHHYDGGNIVSERGENGNRKGLYLRGVNLICQTVDANSYYYLYNAHGDTTSRIDQSGNKSPEYIYDAFGNQRDLIGTDPNPFRYCGEYYDPESGNYYLRARYYDPATGRFGAEDIARDGLNWYTYCDNNPVAFIDPLGLDKQLEDYIKKNYKNKSTVTFLTQQPKPNSREVLKIDVAKLKNDEAGGWDVGHTFIRLDDGNGNIRYVGFYAKKFSITDNIIKQNNTTGHLKDDSEHAWNVGKIYEINEGQYAEITNFIDEYDSDTYNISSKNCTTFAVDALIAADIKSPTSQHFWAAVDTPQHPMIISVPDFNVPLYRGYNPADAGQDIRRAYGQSYILAGENGATAHQNPQRRWWTHY